MQEIMFLLPDEERRQLTLELDEADAENPVPGMVEGRPAPEPNPNEPGKSGVARDPRTMTLTDPGGRIVAGRRRSRFTISARAHYEMGGEMAKTEWDSDGWSYLHLPLGLARWLAGAWPQLLRDYDEQERPCAR